MTIIWLGAGILLILVIVGVVVTITSEKELVEEHGKRGFVILGVNGDEPARLKAVEARGTVTWRSFADGPRGPITRLWGVTGFPTLYIFDHRDTVRFKASGRQSKPPLRNGLPPLRKSCVCRTRSINPSARSWVLAHASPGSGNSRCRNASNPVPW